jgi:hemerythrin-like domain-containing protein
MTKKKKADSNGDLVSFEWGPLKFSGSKGPSEEEIKLKNRLREVMIAYNKLKITNVKLYERLNFYRQMVRDYNSKLNDLSKIPDDKKKEAIEKIQRWIDDITRDDNIKEGKE